MNGARQVSEQRRRSGWGYAVSLVLVVAAAVGCGGPVPEPDTPSHVVVAVSGSAVERQPGTTAGLRQLVAGAAEHEDASLDLVVAHAAGPEREATFDLVPRRGQDVEHNAERRTALEGRTLDAIEARFAQTAGDSGRIDVLGLLGQVARVPGPVTAVVVSSGLQTTGPLAINAVGWDMVGSDAVLDQAVADELLPDLTGKSVVFAGLGDVAGAQDRLPERLRSRLIRMWVGLCERAKAAECRVDTEVAGSATPVSTVPAPLTEVPADPELALPTAAGTPAVTELPADVLFQPNSAQLLPDATALLRGVAGQLQPGARVDLVGRTATFGTAESSRAFSLDRARACKDALVAAGVPAERISTSGLGFDRPLVPDVDAGGRLIPDAARRNRTVTMTITAGGMP